MKNILLILTVLSGLNLTACAVHTREGSVVIDPDGRLIDGGYHDVGSHGRI